MVANFFYDATAAPRAFHPKSRSHRTATAPGGKQLGRMDVGFAGESRPLGTTTCWKFICNWLAVGLQAIRNDAQENAQYRVELRPITPHKVAQTLGHIQDPLPNGTRGKT